MRSKATWILILVLVVVIGGAGVLYKTLGSRYTPDQLTVEATPAPTAAPDGEAATSEAAEPALQEAPDFTAYDADGNAVRLSDYRGKPLVLNFWASW